MFTNKTSRKKESGSLDDIFEGNDTKPESRSNKGYMAELEAWLDETVFEPIERAIEDEDNKELHIAFSEAKQQIKRKVLESYHNGLKTNQSRNQKGYARQTYRRN